MVRKQSCSAYAVIGIGFGDEGKGRQVDSLCQSLENPLVVRYSGGQQAGHTVVTKKLSHVFSNFGSGTLTGARTFWSRHCTIEPVGIIKEYNILGKKGIRPTLSIDKRCPVTTPYDIVYDQETGAKHGTCGVGVGATFEREENNYSLLVGDILYDSVMETKLDIIGGGYYRLSGRGDTFLECCRLIRDYFDIVDSIPEGYKSHIFEGSQGLLLDQDIGFFPHVTRSNVGSKNILEMGFEPYVYLMTRAFQTRHGNGPMTNEGRPHNIKDNPHETNVRNKYQGEFRRSLLDLDLLKYGIEKDEYIRTTKKKELVITCMDLVKNEYRYTVGGKIVNHRNEKKFARAIADYLGIDKVSTTSSPY